MKKRYLVLLIITLMLYASALTCLITIYIMSGARAGKSPGSSVGGSSGDVVAGAVSDYRSLLETIRDQYIGEFDADDVSAAAMHAAVDALGDRWSYYMTPEEYKAYLDASNNRYAGIGVGVDTGDTSAGVLVVSVYKGGPAEMGGVLPGDTITCIDGTNIGGISIDAMRDMLARPIGDSVVLTINRPEEGLISLTLVYNYVFVDPVSYEMLDGNIGYIVLTNFDQGAADGFISAMDTLLEQGARAFVFDVRSNPGGRVVEMTAILDYLLPEGDIFVTVDKSGRENVTKSGPDTIDVPAIVLVDSNSYSAAEYFTAMLGEYGYADSVGEQTTGKNRMQVTIPQNNGGALHISTSQYLTRNRVSLYDTGGYTPDYLLSLTEDEYALFLSGRLDYESDAQLQLALSLLG